MGHERHVECWHVECKHVECWRRCLLEERLLKGGALAAQSETRPHERFDHFGGSGGNGIRLRLGVRRGDAWSAKATHDLHGRRHAALFDLDR